MKSVFILHHSYELDGCDKTKLIGVYTSAAEAESAIGRLKQQPGFCDYPNAFIYDEYELNKDHWNEGFATMTTIAVKDINGRWKSVAAVALKDGNYRIVEKYENHLLEAFKDGDVVRCEEKDYVLYAVEKIGAR
jgi:hypothetical protein